MRYLLKNKDRVVLEFEVESKEVELGEFIKVKERVQIVKNVNIINKSILPLNFNQMLNIDESVKNWLLSRKIPKNRRYVNEIVATYGGNEKNFMDYIDISLALSLNDSYWIIPYDKDYKWRDYNLYENSFDKALELTAFMGVHNEVKGLTSSPEYTTNGMLKKCWRRENNTIYLYKGSSEAYANGGREAYSEYYTQQIAKAMNFNAITYDLVEFHNEVVSTCPLFTNENVGYAPMYYCLSDEAKRNKDQKAIEEIMNIYGKEAFEDLMVFDALIGNTDRHLGNFGMLIDNNTNQILKSAPIFDNGFSFLNYFVEEEFNNIEMNLLKYESYFKNNFATQLKIYLRERHLEAFEKLSIFTFKKHPKFNLKEKWLQNIENYLQQNAKFFLENKHTKKLHKKDKK